MPVSGYGRALSGSGRRPPRSVARDIGDPGVAACLRQYVAAAGRLVALDRAGRLAADLVGGGGDATIEGRPPGGGGEIEVGGDDRGLARLADRGGR